MTLVVTNLNLTEYCFERKAKLLMTIASMVSLKVTEIQVDNAV